MISFSLHMAPETTISLGVLKRSAVSAVIDVLGNCGYMVVPEPVAEAVDDRELLREYRIEPGPAALEVFTERSGIKFVLVGERFGCKARHNDKDPVLWMGLVTLGVGHAETYKVVPQVADPEVKSWDVVYEVVV